MVKVSITVKYPTIEIVEPYRVIEPLSKETKKNRINTINNNFKRLEEWTDAERNYST